VAYLQSLLSYIFFIGFQETLTADFEILKAKLGSPEQMMLPHDETQAHKKLEGLNKALTDQSSQNLKEWYRRDYEFISLCQNIIQDHPNLRDASLMM